MSLDGALLGIAWQATVLLALGLVAGAALRRHPARAHHALVLAVLCALIVPGASAAVRWMGLGILAPRDAAAPSHGPSIPMLAPAHGPATEATGGTGLHSALAAEDPAFARESSAQPAAPTAAATVTGSTEPAARRTPALGWSAWCLGAWLVASLAWASFSALAWLRGRGVVARARAIESGPLRELLERVAARAVLPGAPRLAATRDASCPMVWGWSRPGVLLVPETALREQASELDWEAVFIHELAHVRRGDHRTQALAALLAALLPWHPLAWFARSRLSRWAELACDDWVLEAGRPPAAYAEALLAFVPARRRAWSVAAVTRGPGLRGRVERILGGSRPQPNVGVAWRRAAVAIFALATVVIACAQPGETRLARTEAEDDATTLPPVAIAMPADGGPYVLRGMVVDAGGQAVAGMTVQVFRKEADNNKVALHSSLTTDAAGGFALADGPADDRWWLRVEDPRFAFQWVHANPRSNRGVDEPLVTRIDVQPPRSVSGQVVDEAGYAVAGVRVTLTGEFLTDPKVWAPSIGSYERERFTETDAEGRFTLDHLQGRWVALMLDRDGFAKSFSPGDPRVQTGRDDVRLVIQRGLVLRGRVVADGQPLAGVAISSSASCLADRPLGRWSVTTDDEGRFELRGVCTSVSRKHVLDMPLLAVSVDTPQWTSPRYSVYDSFGSALPLLTIEATRRQDATPAADDSQGAPGSTPTRPLTIEVNRPTEGTLARLSGKPSGTASVVVTLERPERFGGRMPRVWLNSAKGVEPGIERQAFTDDGGRVTFDQLPAGSYAIGVINFTSPNYATRQVEVHDGETLPVDLAPEPHRVHGTIACGGKPVSGGGIDVTALTADSQGDCFRGHGVVHADGTWECVGLPPGPYRIGFDAGDGHSVPSHVFAEVRAGETLLDIALPQTRIDVSIEGRDLVPAEYEDAKRMGTEIWYEIQVCPAGSEQTGGTNACGFLSVTDGDPYAAFVPPGRWTLRTRDAAFRMYAATVELDSDTARVHAVLRRTDGGSGVIQGFFEPDDIEDPGAIRLLAFGKGPTGIDTVSDFGQCEIRAGGYRMSGLPAGTYGLLLWPGDTRQVENPEDPKLPFIYLPDVRVEDGSVIVRDITIPPARNVLIRTPGPDGQPRRALWKLNLGGDDWLPSTLFVGSNGGTFSAPLDAFPLPVGDYRLQTTVLGQPPQVHTIRVEAGTCVQTIDVVLDG